MCLWERLDLLLVKGEKSKCEETDHSEYCHCFPCLHIWSFRIFPWPQFSEFLRLIGTDKPSLLGPSGCPIFTVYEEGICQAPHTFLSVQPAPGLLPSSGSAPISRCFGKHDISHFTFIPNVLIVLLSVLNKSLVHWKYPWTLSIRRVGL